MAEKYKRKPNTKCIVCDKSIYRRPCEIQSNGKRFFCSMVCYGISCRKEKPCIVCGKLILSGLHKKTCDRSCANKHRVGIKYKIGRPRDKAKSQLILKVRLLKDRGRCCERCSYDKYDVLQVHHKNRDRRDNSMDNLELICPNCHCEEHYLKR